MKPTRPSPYWSLRICLAGSVLLVAWAVTRPQPPSDWLKVEADRYALRNYRFHVRVDVAPANLVSRFLVVDLHWTTHHHEPRGFLTGSTTHRIVAEGGSYVFPFSIPDRDELGYVFGVIYVGPSDRWEERERSAFTDPVAVRRSADSGER